MSEVCAYVYIGLSYRHSTEPMETKLLLNQITKINHGTTKSILSGCTFHTKKTKDIDKLHGCHIFILYFKVMLLLVNLHIDSHNRIMYSGKFS